MKVAPNLELGRTKKLALDSKIERWEYVDDQLAACTNLEAHVRAVVAGLIVISDFVDELGLSEPQK